MAVSVFDLFKIGIGPSSSHTVGPMRAARMFMQRLFAEGLAQETARVKCELFGSLGATGKGHGSDKAVMLGLSGYEPETVDVERIPSWLQVIRQEQKIHFSISAHQHIWRFDESRDLIFHRSSTLPFHANGMSFTAYSASEQELCTRRYYSVGGGFIVSEELASDGSRHARVAPDTTVLAHPFHSAQDLLNLTASLGVPISDIMRRNERHWRSDAEIDLGLDRIWAAMADCVARGCRTEGQLPGGFKVQRRAAQWHRNLMANTPSELQDPLLVMDWVNLFALAVNEENAAGGRVVTAPTNGAAGIVPAVLHYYDRFVSGANAQGRRRFLLTAGAIGILYKENASISGAEVGCQGEVGVACSMAAGALCEVLGGTPTQVENAAEIGMEHHLGLTCDPVGGLVQIPCIERNAIAAVKAINAARMALRGDGQHKVSLDKVIRTMRETGADMKSKYKETARGGLAVNVVEC